MTQTHEVTNNPESLNSDVWSEALPKLLEIGVSPDIATRAQQVAAMSGEGVTALMTAIHTAVVPHIAHTPQEDAAHISSPDGSSKRELMQPSERQPLMDYAASLVQQLSEKRETADDDKTFLKRAADVVALSIVLTHTFSDGNGRTARTAAQLIREGLDESSPGSISDMKVLSANRPNKSFRISSYLPTDKVTELDPGQLLDVATALDIPLKDEATYQALKQEAYTAPYPD